MTLTHRRHRDRHRYIYNNATLDMTHPKEASAHTQTEKEGQEGKRREERGRESANISSSMTRKPPDIDTR
jgi:hypothetical protein